jgi:hypothetical protein
MGAPFLTLLTHAGAGLGKGSAGTLGRGGGGIGFRLRGEGGIAGLHQRQTRLDPFFHQWAQHLGLLPCRIALSQLGGMGGVGLGDGTLGLGDARLCRGHRAGQFGLTRGIGFLFAGNR